MEDYKQKPVVVIDNGSGVMKAGLSDKDRAILVPTVIGWPKLPVVFPDTNIKDQYIGECALKRRAVLSLNHPVEHGHVKNWGDMEAIWRYIYNELKIDASDRAVLLTEPPLNSNANRDKMVEVMFEGFNVPALYVVVGAILALYSTGRCCGVVLDSGDGISYAAPIYAGCLMENNIQRTNVAGRDVTDYLAALLTNSGYDLFTKAHRDIVREAKEKTCYVARNLQREQTKKQTMYVNYQLPDGQEMRFCNERYLAPEVLFNPDLIGIEGKGISELVFDAILSCKEQDIRCTLADNVVLVGGSTQFPRFEKRLKRDLLHFDKDQEYSFDVLASPRRNLSAWKGGAMLAAEGAFNNYWINKREYMEQGAYIVRNKRRFLLPCLPESASHLL